jgi:hypothetical protein
MTTAVWKASATMENRRRPPHNRARPSRTYTPRLTAVVATSADKHTRLFHRFTPHAVLDALPMFHKAGQGTPATGRPAGLPAEQSAVGSGVDDQHDSHGVTAREPRGATAASILRTGELDATLGYGRRAAAAAAEAVASHKLQGGTRLGERRGLPWGPHLTIDQRQGEHAHVALV